MKRIICLYLVALFLDTRSCDASPFADVNQAEIEYGRGVHAFYGGKYKDAVEILQGLEKQESKDPRVYYYLALSSLRLKQNKEAESYFEKAVDLEFNASLLRDYDIPEALRRIQGAERKKVETFRGAALTKRQAAQKKQDEIKYSERRKSDSQIIESFAKPEAKYDAAVLQELSKSSNTSTVALQNPHDLLSHENPFGARPIDPTNPSREVKAVVPRKVVAKTTAVNVGSVSTGEQKNEEPDDSDEEAATEKPKQVKKESKPSKVKPAADAPDEDENPFERGRVKTKLNDNKEPSEEDSSDEEKTDEKSETKSAGNSGGAVAKSLGRSLSELLTKKSNKSNKEAEDESEKEEKLPAVRVKKTTTDDNSKETDEDEEK